MKARVIATNEVVEINGYDTDKKGNLYYYTKDYDQYHESEVEILFAKDPDYWDKLLHQYAGMAMQGILANIDLLMSLANKKAADYPAKYTVAEFAKDCATALVEKLKEGKI